MNIMELLKIIVLGIVEGFTEWLPISTTGHMILVEDMIQLEVTEDFRKVFFAVIQLGAIMAVLMLYFRKLNPFDRGKNETQQIGTIRLWIKILIACLPAAVLRLLLNEWMTNHLLNAFVVAIVLVLYGAMFLYIEKRVGYKEFMIHKTGQINGQTALYIGLFQILTLIPGTSRSGMLIMGAMLLGCNRVVATEFSFFIGVPMVLGSSLMGLIKHGIHFTSVEILYLILGTIVVFFVSIYSIRFLISYIRKSDFQFFGYYQITLGFIVLLYFGVSAFMG